MAVSDFLWCLTWPLFLTDAIISNRQAFLEAFCEIGAFTRSVSQSVNNHGQVRRYCDPFKVTLLTKNVRTFLLLSTLFLFIAACFPVALYYKMERDGHVIYCGATLKDALLDYNLLFAFFRWFHCLNLVIFILYLRITRLEQKAATRMYGVLVGYDRNDHRVRAGVMGRKKRARFSSGPFLPLSSPRTHS